MFKTKTALPSKTSNKTCQNAPQVVNSGASLRRGGQINYLYAFIVMCSTLFGVFAPTKGWGQNLLTCGQFNDGYLQTQQNLADSIYGFPKVVQKLDRFGNKYYVRLSGAGGSSGAAPAGSSAMLATPCTTANGMFQLNFLDDNGFGFDAPAPHGPTRAQVVCAAFEYISQVLQGAGMGCTQTVQVQIEESADIPISSIVPLAVATPFYTHQGEGDAVLHGDVWKVINAGINVNGPHAKIRFNFSNTINWQYHLTQPATPGIGPELYAVTLHEILHTLGFSSYVNNPSSCPAVGGRHFDWDMHLVSNGNSLFNMPNTANPYVWNCNGNITAGCANTHFDTPNVPVHAPSTFSGASLDHLDNCNGTPGTSHYVMHPFQIAGQPAIFSLTTEELNILCQLGYTVVIPGFGICNAEVPAGGYDGAGYGSCDSAYIIQNCGGATPPLVITFADLISNDRNTVGIVPNSLEIVRGSGTLNIDVAAQDFAYTPSASGVTILRYLPLGANGRVGNITYVYIMVENCVDPSFNFGCVDNDTTFQNTCNLICNSHFRDLSGNDCFCPQATYPIRFWGIGAPNAICACLDLSGWGLSGSSDILLRRTAPNDYFIEQATPQSGQCSNIVMTNVNFQENKSYIISYRKRVSIPGNSVTPTIADATDIAAVETFWAQSGFLQTACPLNDFEISTEIPTNMAWSQTVACFTVPQHPDSGSYNRLYFKDLKETSLDDVFLIEDNFSAGPDFIDVMCHDTVDIGIPVCQVDGMRFQWFDITDPNNRIALNAPTTATTLTVTADRTRKYELMRTYLQGITVLNGCDTLRDTTMVQVLNGGDDPGFTADIDCYDVAFTANAQDGSHVWTVRNAVGTILHTITTGMSFSYSFPEFTAGTYTVTHCFTNLCGSGCNTMELVFDVCCQDANLTIGLNNNSVSSLHAVIVANPAFFSGSGTSYSASHKNFIINGTLNIDVPFFQAGQCKFNMGEGANIQVLPYNTLSLKTCHLKSSCRTFWKGVVTQVGAKRLIAAGSIFEDAETAIELKSRTSANIQMDTFRNNVIGIYVAPAAINNPLATENTIFWDVNPYGNAFLTNHNLDIRAPFAGQVFTPNTTAGNPLWRRGLAGIFMNDVTNLPLGSPSSATVSMPVNSFYDLMNGVLLRNTPATIINSTFAGIKRNWSFNTTFDIVNNPAVIPSGWAIHSEGSSKTYLEVTKQGTTSIANCESGIHSRNGKTSVTGISVQVWGNPFSSSFLHPVAGTEGRGISVIGRSVGIEDNTITSGNRGIIVSSATTRLKVLRDTVNLQNIFNATGIEISSSGTGTTIPVGFIPANLSHSIEGNDVFLLGNGFVTGTTVATARRGILINLCPNVAVLGNDVTAPSTNRFHTAINVTSSNGINLHCNEVAGYSAASGNSATNLNPASGANGAQNDLNHAYRIETTTNSILSCNSATRTRSGFRFNGTCSGTDFRGNEIGTHRIGLHVSSTSLMGGQNNKGNHWSAPSYPIWGAVNQNNTGANSLKFKIFPFTGTNRPPNGLSGVGINQLGAIVPDLNGFWFLGSTPNPIFVCGNLGGTGQNCQTNYPLVVSSGNEEEVMEEQIALGEIPVAEYSEEINWKLDKDLYEKIAEDPTAYQDDPALMTFYNEMMGETLGDLSESDKMLEEVYEANPATELLLNTKLYEMAGIRYNIDQQEAALAQTQTDAEREAIYEAKKVLYELLALKSEEAEMLRDLVKAETDGNANAGITFTDDITTAKVYEENLRIVNKIFFETVAKENYEFSAVQWNTIDNIALQCPISGGPGVYTARSLYALKADRNYLDEEACLSVGILLREGEPKERTFTAYPNPNDGNFLIQWDEPLKENEKATLTITDVLGKTLLTENIEAGSTYFAYQSNDRLNNGIYFCKLSIENGAVYTCKIVISN